jgi:hypothetical protein
LLDFGRLCEPRATTALPRFCERGLGWAAKRLASVAYLLHAKW